jgi:hypothetical protein
LPLCRPNFALSLGEQIRPPIENQKQAIAPQQRDRTTKGSKMKRPHYLIGYLPPPAVKATTLLLTLLHTACLYARANEPAVPAALQVPAGNTLEFHYRGVGVQIYTWNAALATWGASTPHAVLFNDGGVAAIHYAGPTWQSTDGSKVVGTKLAAAIVDPTAIPWLLLEAASETGPGVLGDITYVQRVETKGGLAPAAPGTVDGQQALVPYSAEYLFYRTSLVLAPQSIAYGATYGEWAARWWQRKFSLPVDAASLSEPLSYGQSGPVWILDGPGVLIQPITTRIENFSVPDNKALFLDILTTEDDDSDCPNFDTFTVDQLEATIAGITSHYTEMVCTVDGVNIPGLSNPQTSPYLIDSPVFSYTLADHDNVAAVDEGLTCIPNGITIGTAVARGVFLMLAPLPVGQHTIHTLGISGPVASPHLELDETYNITVTPHDDRD